MIQKRQPVRTCIVCRQECGKKGLIRIVKNKDGLVFYDKTGKADGRGAYVCDSPDCIEKLKKTKALSRTFKTEINDSVYDEIIKEISQNAK